MVVEQPRRVDYRFDRNVAVVTGGGSGIGRGISHRIGRSGATVIVADLVEKRAAEVAREVIDAGGAAFGLGIDVSREEDAERMVNTAVERQGRLDFLIHCAGNIHVPHPVAEMPLADWQGLLDVHLTGMFLSCRAAVDPLSKTGGRIVSLSSNYGFKGRPEGSHYSAAKAGIVGLTKVLAAELAPDVNVNAIAPGPIDTPRWRAGLSDEEYTAKRARRVKDIPAGRMGRPEDIASAVMFLLGPDSEWMTGQVLHVNGGEFTP